MFGALAGAELAIDALAGFFGFTPDSELVAGEWNSVETITSIGVVKYKILLANSNSMIIPVKVVRSIPSEAVINWRHGNFERALMGSILHARSGWRKIFRRDGCK
jgi:hypothetical protein